MTVALAPALSRRIILALLGWRYRDGVWVGPTGPLLTAEQLDTMPERRWRAFLRRWAASAATN